MSCAELLERQELCDPDEKVLHWRADGDGSDDEEDHIVDLQALQAEQDQIERCLFSPYNLQLSNSLSN